jgi:Holliday junction resolvasome RuvABC ATP-dependent DNA helicase subunit
MSRPAPRFNEFIGHKQKVDYLRRLIAGATARGEPFPSLLLTGPSGVGKTRLVQAVAAEFGTNVIAAMGYLDRAEIGRKLAAVSTNDFLFIDECHGLAPPVQELLCEALDHGSIPAPEAKRGAQPTEARRVELKPFTLALATDQPGRLLDALRKRVDEKIALTFYPERELREIVASMAEKLNMLISPQATGTIARASAGLPRRAWQLLGNLRLFHPGSESSQLGVEHVREFLAARGIDERGLGPEECGYLRAVADLGGASLETIAQHLGTDTADVLRQIEPWLVRLGLVKITSAGRNLTPKGHQRLAGAGGPAADALEDADA